MDDFVNTSPATVTANVITASGGLVKQSPYVLKRKTLDKPLEILLINSMGNDTVIKQRKRAKFVALLKKDDRENILNYRSESLMNTVCKRKSKQRRGYLREKLHWFRGKEL